MQTPASKDTELQVLLDDESNTPTFYDHIKRCWNLKKNARTLFKANNSRYGVLDGVRALSVLWVILVHSYVLYPKATASLTSSFPMRFVLNGVYGVDSFFVLSGFLIYYILNKEFTNKGQMNVKRFYLRRWLRLSPAYFTCLAIYWGVSSQVNQTENSYCVHYWWSNLLFFNNFISENEQCMYWSWSIAIEMQFYLISPIFMYIIHWRRSVGKKVLYLGILVFTLTRLGITLYLGFIVDRSDEWVQFVYLTPWGRIAPFLVGMVTCMYLEEVENKYKLDLQEPTPSSSSSLSHIIFWSACIVLFITGGIWTSHDLNDPLWSTGLALVFGPLILGCCVAYIVYYLQVFGTEKNYLKRFLCWRVFGIIAQLSYGMYLAAPMFQMIIYKVATNLPVITFWQLLGWWIAFSSLSFISAVILYFIVEKPMMLIVS